MNHLLGRKKSSSSLRGKQSEASSAGSSDQNPRDVKSALYQDARYETILATKGSFMSKSRRHCYEQELLPNPPRDRANIS